MAKGTCAFISTQVNPANSINNKCSNADIENMKVLDAGNAVTSYYHDGVEY